MSAFDTTLGHRRQTEDGSQIVYYLNDTGSDSVKGTLVEPSGSVVKGVVTAAADCIDPVGIVLKSGIPDGELMPIVISGPAQVLLEDSSACTVGYWARTSITQAGRADMSNAAPAGGTIGALEGHMHEIGHCLESVTAGTDKLAWVHLHFN